jgi:hypothetical protein
VIKQVGYLSITDYFAQESLTHVLVLLHLDSIHGPHDGRMQVWDAVGLDGDLRSDLDDTPRLRWVQTCQQTSNPMEALQPLTKPRETLIAGGPGA